MTKLLMFLCTVIMFFGLVGYLWDDPAITVNKSSFSLTTVNSYEEPSTGDNPHTARELATPILLGFGLVGLAVFGRKKFKK